MNGPAAGIHRADWPAFEPARPPAPTPQRLLEARRLLQGSLGPAPSMHSAALSEAFGRQVYVKFEQLGPVRSFKLRGALVFMHSLDAGARARGVITASTGNHAQGVALAGRMTGVPATIVLPHGTAAVKLEALRRIGADVRFAGEVLGEAALEAHAIAERDGRVYLEDGEDPQLMAGAAGVVWELLEERPELDMVLVPVGGGNLVAGSLLAAAALKPSVEIVGVQSDAASGATASWLAGELAERSCTTIAGGLGTTRPGALSLGVMRALLRTMAVVPEADLWTAIATLYAATGQVGEHAAVAGLAALARFGDELPAERVGLLVTGGHLSAEHLVQALTAAPVAVGAAG